MSKIYGDRWRYVRDLGQGGQALVHIVEEQHSELKGQYALKRLRGDGSPKALQRFHREVAVLKDVVHPGIVRLVDYSMSDDKNPFYVMEYIAESRPLSNFLGTDSNPFCHSPVRALNFAIDMLDALNSCHQKGIIHRDLSPSNVLLVPGDPRPRLTDFGLCQIENGSTITLSDEGVGTQNYMAPECEVGAEGAVGPPADIYSVGKLLWAALFNQHAFSREAPAFQSKSPSRMMPDDEAAWHFHHVFAVTIRHDPTKRAQDASAAISVCKTVLRLIDGGYMPLEQLAAGKCPHCGFGKMVEFEAGYTVFGNPNPRGVESVQCNHCGYSAPVNFGLARDTLRQRSELV